MRRNSPAAKVAVWFVHSSQVAVDIRTIVLRQTSKKLLAVTEKPGRPVDSLRDWRWVTGARLLAIELSVIFRHCGRFSWQYN